VLPAQPLHKPRLDEPPKVECSVRHSMCTAGADFIECKTQVFSRIGQVGEDRHHKHRYPETSIRCCSNCGKSCLKTWGTRFDTFLKLRVENGDRHSNVNIDLLPKFTQQGNVASK